MIGRVIFVVCFLGVTVPARLQASGGGEVTGTDIRGIVADSASGERITGANVMLRGTTRGATSNNNGFYLITAVAAGNYELVASAVGYAPYVVQITVQGGTPLTVNIRLSSQLIEVNEMVVQSTAISAFAERSASIHVITPRELQRIPAAAQQDLLRSLQLLPGIASTSDVSAKFYVRGGAGDQNLILLDGMKIYNPFHAFGLFSILDPDITRSAEVYTAAFPAGYGGRLSSVVNVSTRDGNLSRVAGSANINFLSGKLELDGPVAGDNSWLVSGRTSLFSGSLNRMVPNPSPVKFYDLFVKGTAGTSTGRIGFRGYTSGDDIEPSTPDQPKHSWRNGAVSVVLSGLLADRSYFDAAVSYSRSETRRISPAGSGVTIAPASSKLEEVTVRSEVTSFTEGEGTFFEGFEFVFPSVVDSLSVNGLTPRQFTFTGIEPYVWVRYEGGGSDRLRYDLGLHADIGALLAGGALQQCLQPRITLSWMLSDSWLAKASFGIFTQKLITVSNEDDLISLFDAWLYLPQELGLEEARHYVLGVEGNLMPALAVGLQGYVKDYRSLILYNTAKVYPSDPDFINGTGRATGAEFLVRYSLPFVDLYASYAWSRVSLSNAGLLYAPRYDRRQTIKAIGTFHLATGLDATLRWDYGSGYPFTQGAGYYDRLALADLGTSLLPAGGSVPVGTLGAKNAARLPAYHRLDLGLSYRLALGTVRSVLGVSVVNVYNAKNIMYYDRFTRKTDYMTPFFPTASLAVEF